jgi:hypothetical protein
MQRKLPRPRLQRDSSVCVLNDHYARQRAEGERKPPCLARRHDRHLFGYITDSFVLGAL